MSEKLNIVSMTLRFYMEENSQIVLSKYISKNLILFDQQFHQKYITNSGFFINQYLYYLKRIKINIDRLERIKSVIEN